MPLVLAREEGLSVVDNAYVGSILYCSVVGEGISLCSFNNCPSSNDSIILRHTTEYINTSDNGSITGEGTLVDGDCFTSQLNISYTPDSNVTYIYENESIEVVIGTTDISIVSEETNESGKSTQYTCRMFSPDPLGGGG